MKYFLFTNFKFSSKDDYDDPIEDEDITASGDEYSDIDEEYEAGDYGDELDNDIEEEEEEPEITTSRPSLISIPLVIEEKDGDVKATGNRPGDPTVILAGTDEERKPDTLYGGPIAGYGDDYADIRQARQTNANSPAHSQGVRIRPPSSFQYIDPPQKKRQVKAKDLPVTRLLSGRGGQDWSQRLRERQRQRIWRQFNLDRRQGRVYFNNNQARDYA